MIRTTLRTFALVIAFSNHAFAQDRMPAIPPEKYDEAQTKAAAEFLATRKVPVFGPFIPLIRSPEVMLRAKEMGDYLRYKTGLGDKLSEFVILITAREWTQDYEWYVHHPIALKVGLAPAIADALRDGRRPDAMSEDEALIYDFCIELHRNKRVSDAIYAKAVARFGEKGVIDLVGVNGYYTLLAMALNTTRAEVPKDFVKLPRFPE